MPRLAPRPSRSSENLNPDLSVLRKWHKLGDHMSKDEREWNDPVIPSRPSSGPGQTPTTCRHSLWQLLDVNGSPNFRCRVCSIDANQSRQPPETCRHSLWQLVRVDGAAHFYCKACGIDADQLTTASARPAQRRPKQAAGGRDVVALEDGDELRGLAVIDSPLSSGETPGSFVEPNSSPSAVPWKATDTEHDHHHPAEPRSVNSAAPTRPPPPPPFTINTDSVLTTSSVAIQPDPSTLPPPRIPRPPIPDTPATSSKRVSLRLDPAAVVLPSEPVVPPAHPTPKRLSIHRAPRWFETVPALSVRVKLSPKGKPTPGGGNTTPPRSTPTRATQHTSRPARSPKTHLALSGANDARVLQRMLACAIFLLPEGHAPEMGREKRFGVVEGERREGEEQWAVDVGGEGVGRRGGRGVVPDERGRAVPVGGAGRGAESIKYRVVIAERNA
ncbi:hypothetical protein P152DRAFT_475029 [Eremomyces bilateralis CBS 781.70]|uniref:Uncharacterized protein n=1 Tax=Eremomyces bilateralis CBS 781.70 TaxID=1392243 RepID=A0A6G1FZ65_9PEZI|nr:uncharacterized protein P152DRAFT_475029 [Eremomyces bilateralis CBS 781.70]KAF1810966.1 hypothetical protein P152DRAFT_475029 [Eremomyces bilateralis CBS 781.70]